MLIRPKHTGPLKANKPGAAKRTGAPKCTTCQVKMAKGKLGRCDDCRTRARSDHVMVSSPEMDPHREDRIRLYIERAARNEPLFTVKV